MNGASPSGGQAAPPIPPLPPRLRPDAAQRAYAAVSHWVTLAVCLAALAAPVAALALPGACRLDARTMFGALFSGDKPETIWARAGVDFPALGFWGLLREAWATPDGLAMMTVALGCAVTLLALLPAALAHLARRDWWHAALAAAVAGLSALAMSGAVAMGD